MAFKSSTEFITYKLESAPGVFDATVETTDVDIRLRDIEWSNEQEVDDESSSYQNGTWHGADESIIGKKKVTAGFSLKVAPGEFTPETDPGISGDASHKLNYDSIFQNCGMNHVEENTNAIENTEGLYVFYPDQAYSEKTMSLARMLYDSNANRYQVSLAGGGMSNFTLNAEGTSKPWTLKFDNQARSEGVVDNDGTTIGKFDNTNVMRTVADALKNTIVRITDIETSVSTNFCVTKINMESGNDIQEVECQEGESGIKNYFIASIDPKIVLDPLLRTLADYNWWEAVSTERFYTIEIESEFISLYIPRAQIITNNVGDSNGIMRNELSFRVLQNIDSYTPAWGATALGGLTTTELSRIPYFIGIEEKLADY